VSRPPGLPKTGGRQKGTRNKTSARFKEFLDEVFEAAYSDPRFKTGLVNGLVTLTLDAKTFALLVAHHAGLPPKQVELAHSGKITLEQIVTGVGLPDEDEDDDDDTEAAEEPEAGA
jgi:hypothetical protein